MASQQQRRGASLTTLFDRDFEWTKQTRFAGSTGSTTALYPDSSGAGSRAHAPIRCQIDDERGRHFAGSALLQRSPIDGKSPPCGEKVVLGDTFNSARHGNSAVTGRESTPISSTPRRQLARDTQTRTNRTSVRFRRLLWAVTPWIPRGNRPILTAIARRPRRAPVLPESCRRTWYDRQPPANASVARSAIPGWLSRLCGPWPRAGTARRSWSAPACAGCRISTSRA